MFRSSLDGSGKWYMVGRVGFQFTEAFHRWSATKVSMAPSADVRTAAYLRCSPAENRQPWSQERGTMRMHEKMHWSPQPLAGS
jgi:hypothetical protein